MQFAYPGYRKVVCTHDNCRCRKMMISIDSGNKLNRCFDVLYSCTNPPNFNALYILFRQFQTKQHFGGMMSEYLSTMVGQKVFIVNK